MADKYSKYNYSDKYANSSVGKHPGRASSNSTGGRSAVKASYGSDDGRRSRQDKTAGNPAGAAAQPARLLLGWLGVVLLMVLALVLYKTVSEDYKQRGAVSEIAEQQPETSAPAAAQTQSPQPETSPETDPETEEEPVEIILEKPPVNYDFQPRSVESTEPSKLIDIQRIMVNDKELEDITTYENTYGEISFGDGSEYTSVEGVVTFRGNNYRNQPSYGEVETLTSKKLTRAWTVTTGQLTDYWGNLWTGNGWTGQSLVVKWPKALREKMTTMESWAKEKEELVEVITASMGGKVYFTELSTGKATRKTLDMGMTYKGGGALDPRGYPILYLGSGVKNANGQSMVSIVNLLDCTVMYTFGAKDSFGSRDWPMFDSSPLVDAETDQLIYPSENGLLYIIHLNTQYDEEAGTLSINPDNVVKWRYHNVRSNESALADPFFSGIESSAAIYKGYIYLAENGGALMCLDLNTLQLVWVQDILDDSNSSPVIDIEEDGHPYIYISTSFHLGWRSSSTATVPIWKIDAETGEIIWQVDYTCQSEKGVSGGVEGTIAVDDSSIYVPVAKADSPIKGTLVSIDKKTGEKNWEKQTNIYSWASPIRFDDASGKKYILYNNGYGGEGYLYLIDAETGDVLDTLSMGGVAEASCVMYENWVVLPTRSSTIVGIQVS